MSRVGITPILLVLVLLPARVGSVMTAGRLSCAVSADSVGPLLQRRSAGGDDVNGNDDVISSDGVTAGGGAIICAWDDVITGDVIDDVISDDDVIAATAPLWILLLMLPSLPLV